MFKPLCIAAFLVALGASSALSDTVTLKSGKSYEGTILRETDEEIVMLISVTESITDEVVIRKEDIRGAAVKTPEDIVEFQKLKAFDVKLNSMSLSAYDEAIAACETFQSRFPQSAHRQQVANQIKTLKEEKARVARSDIKVNKRWYTPKEAETESYQIKAQLLFHQMQERAAAGDYIGALNLFDTLEKGHPHSVAYPKGVALALSILPKLRAIIARDVPVAERKAAQFREAVQFQREPERSQMIAAHQRELARAEGLFKKSNAKWKPFFPLVSGSASSLASQIPSETQRLAAINTAPMVESGDASEAARDLLDARKPDEAQARLDAAKRLWSQNEAVPRLINAVQTLREVLIAEQEAREKAEAEVAKQKERDAMDARVE